MSYLVLARKWRPRRFSELVGQEHVVRALTNALDTGRIHHAFLFTGTRGVGKTTIARIFAKSLNCERGTSSEPCGECETCLAIDAGRYLDLLEIDAASNTGVDDVRELIENAQYMPSRGRFKVYLIDEVHMLSKAAFNALLKTLEEPPGHVKFLFATTDPEKLLVTVLSRCLQFNLKRLDEDQIAGQIEMILAAEGIQADAGAVRQLARAADGSLRDGLSLLDQAIAYGGGEGGRLDDASVAAMLGTVDRTRVAALLGALSEGDGAALLGEVEALAQLAPEWTGVLDALAEALHRIQVRQLVPGARLEADAVDIDAIAARVRPEVVQLWYQMALNGRRDLPLAPSARAGFEMAVLRMLAFRPSADGDSGGGEESRGDGRRTLSGPAAARAALADAAPATRRARPGPAEPDPAEPGPAHAGGATARGTTSGGATPGVATRDRALPDPDPVAVAAPGAAAAPDARAAAATEAAAAPAPSEEARSAPEARTRPDAVPPARADARADRSEPPPGAEATALDAEGWLRLVADSQLKGPPRELAAHAAFEAYADGVLTLSLAEADALLQTPASERALAEALAPGLGRTPRLQFKARPGDREVETLSHRSARERDARQAAAETAFLADPGVQRLMQRHGARVVPDSIRPRDDA